MSGREDLFDVPTDELENDLNESFDEGSEEERERDDGSDTEVSEREQCDDDEECDIRDVDDKELQDAKAKSVARVASDSENEVEVNKTLKPESQQNKVKSTFQKRQEKNPSDKNANKKTSAPRRRKQSSHMEVLSRDIRYLIGLLETVFAILAHNLTQEQLTDLIRQEPEVLERLRIAREEVGHNFAPIEANPGPSTSNPLDISAQIADLEAQHTEIAALVRHHQGKRQFGQEHSGKSKKAKK